MTTKSSQDLIQKLLQSCFSSLTAICPAWKQAVMGNPEAWAREYKTQLLTSMIENSINSQELINRGLAKARGEAKPWLPGPGEFCQWCLPSAQDYGLPSAQEAFDDCRKQVGKPAAYRHWKHEIVYLTAVEFGFFELKTLQDNDKSINSKFKSFERIYQSYADRVIAGEILTVPPENRIENHEIKITDRDKNAGSHAINSLKNLFGDE